MCDDATIKVRRLVHNFEEKMRWTEAEVWNDSHELRPDFSFTGISTAGLSNIILLHDWYATNAPGRTYGEMGFNSEEEFLEFRRKCNVISYNLRLNQYAKMIEVQKTRLQNRINELTGLIEGANHLKYKDVYGRNPDLDNRDDGSVAKWKDFKVFMDADKIIDDMEERSTRTMRGAAVKESFGRFREFVLADMKMKGGKKVNVSEIEVKNAIDRFWDFIQKVEKEDEGGRKSK